jgi:hypothetical protein
LPIASLAFALGCGGEHDATEKQLGELRAEISRLRAGESSLRERLDTIDIERNALARGPSMAPPVSPATPASPTAPAARAGDRDRPDLDVVRLSPSEGDGDADNDPSRPVVRAAGDGPGARSAQTLNNKTLSSRASPRKSVATAAPKKTDADARPVAKP